MSSDSRWVPLVEQYLVEQKHSWAWFSVKVRVAQVALSLAKRGQLRLKRPVQRRIARILGVRTSDLFGPEEP